MTHPDLIPIPHTPEKNAVLRALLGLGFFEWFDGNYRRDDPEGSLYIPECQAETFDQAARFLGSGFFDLGLSIPVRRAYYAASQSLLKSAKIYR